MNERLFIPILPILEIQVYVCKEIIFMKNISTLHINIKIFYLGIYEQQIVNSNIDIDKKKFNQWIINLGKTFLLQNF